MPKDSTSSHWIGLLTTGRGVGLLIVILVALNIVSARLFVRADLTQERIFTLSDGTRRILSKLEEPVRVKFYFSRSEQELPPMIKTYATRVEEVLREYAAVSAGKLTLEVVDPRPDSEDEEWARRYGLNGVRLSSGDEAFLGAVLSQGKREVAVPYFDIRTEEFLEKDISEALVRVTKKEKAKVGLLSGIPLSGRPAMGIPGMGEGSAPWVLYQELEKSFALESLANDIKAIPAGMSLVIAFHPKGMSDATQYALDQYVLGGGRLLVVVDPFARADLANIAPMMQQSGQMPQSSSDLPKLFAGWGVEYRPAEIVGDREKMVMVTAGGMRVPYPFFISLDESKVAKGHAITQGLKNLLFAEPGAIALKEGSSYVLEPLVVTSTASGAASGGLAAMMGPAEFSKDFKPDGKERVLVGLLRGKFKSAFADGPPAGAEGQHLAEGSSETSALIMTDSDMFHDSNAVDIFRLGNQTIARNRNDNLALLFNAVDVLAGSEDLISIRSRGRVARPFTRVQEIQSSAQQRWQQEEDLLSQRLSDLQAKLNDLERQKASGSRFALDSAQEAELERFRMEQIDIKRRRREVRKNLREDIERLGSRLAAANLLVVPLAVSGFGIAVFVRRARRMRAARGQR